MLQQSCVDWHVAGWRSLLPECQLHARLAFFEPVLRKRHQSWIVVCAAQPITMPCMNRIAHSSLEAALYLPGTAMLVRHCQDADPC